MTKKPKVLRDKALLKSLRDLLSVKTDAQALAKVKEEAETLAALRKILGGGTNAETVAIAAGILELAQKRVEWVLFVHDNGTRQTDIQWSPTCSPARVLELIGIMSQGVIRTQLADEEAASEAAKEAAKEEIQAKGEDPGDGLRDLEAAPEKANVKKA